MRLKIYGCLLVKDILGKADSVVREAQYDLSPQVLKLCHQIYNEALPILYEKNTFYIACLRVDNHPELVQISASDASDDDMNYSSSIDVQGPQVELCPITRYSNNLTTVPFPIPNLYNHAITLRRIKHWRVVVSRLRNAGGTWNPRWSLFDFCRSICAKPPATLEVLLLPPGLDNSEDDTYFFNDCDILLDPLRMLRNLQRFDVKVACDSDLPDIIQSAPDGVLERFEDPEDSEDDYWGISEDLKMELQTLVTSQQPVDLLIMMHESLVTYAQAFERYPPYKIQMGLRREDIINLDTRDPEYCEFLEPRAFNPFSTPTLHPLEYELACCKDAAISGYGEIFKEHRRNALSYLEAQWARIEEANREMTEFVKEEKVSHKLFDVAERKRRRPGSWSTFAMSDYERQAKIELALTYLEDYAAAFNRDLTRTIRAQINKGRRLFENHYSSLPRDSLINQISKEVEVGKNRHFLRMFSSAVDMCDMQYLEILRARKKLFEYDGLDPECVIDLKSNRSEEMIDWNTNEPELTAVKEWRDYLYGDSDDDEM